MFDFGLLLKQLRDSKGYTQEQLAKKINKSKSAVSRYESNLKIPPLDTLKDLAVLFNVSLDYLAGVDKRESVIIEDLSPEQKDAVKLLLVEFRDKKSNAHNGLTKRQLDIFNLLLSAFYNKS